MAILLNDVLNFKELNNVKIRFNQDNGGNYEPLRLYKEDKKQLLKGQFWNYSKNKSFKEGQVAVGFAKISEDKWLLFDISIITKDLNLFNATGYEYETCIDYEKYFGRIIIKYKNPPHVQNLIRNAESVINQCEISQILDDTFDNDLFPGYENINLSWFDLKRVIEKNVWKTALENQKGIYLIVDSNSGKMYVGSAYGENMILGRWKNYIENGHGGNKELKTLDFEYIKQNFRYSILDIYKSTIEDKIIIERESWWKNLLQTRKFGYNKN
jgi:hypothetical protein